MDWTDPANNERLRALWGEGLSTAEIGRRMGVTKNVIVGRAHRMKLAGRASPIIQTGERKPRPSRAKETLPVPTLARLQSEEARRHAALPGFLASLERRTTTRAEEPLLDVADYERDAFVWRGPNRNRVSAKARLPVPDHVSPHRTCQFIEGEKPFAFCGEPAVSQRSYCRRHCEVCFVQRPINEAAADAA